MFAQAYLEEIGNKRLRHEEQLIRSECERRDIPTVLYPGKRIQRRQLPLTKADFICGDMDAMHGAMKQLQVPVPMPNDYPDCLQPWFGRRVWKSTLGEIARHFYEGEGSEVFMKPADRRKQFTGSVFSSSEDLYAISRISRSETVWCSEVVNWVAEYRVYVVDETVVSLDHYSGDSQLTPSREAIQEAISEYKRSGQAPAAYGIDFGLLESGQTALVEANDGYALGAYQIDAAAYTEVLFTRWQELLRSADASE